MTETSVAEFGTTADGQVVHRYVLDNGHIVLALLTRGAAVQALSVPGPHDSLEDVVLELGLMTQVDLRSALAAHSLPRAASASTS